MEFNNVAILITENCNARCKMCCDSRGVVCGKTLSEAELLHVLQDIKECTYVKHVGITGGEPLLYENLLDIIFNFDFEREVTISLKSNGFWGRDIGKTEEIIKKYQYKLSNISLSYDEFHMQFIDVQSIKNIIHIAHKYRVPTDVVACSLKSTLTPGDILNKLGESAYLTKFCYQPVICTGSGKLFEENDYIKLLDTQKDEIRCMAIVQPDILINPRLEVYPCCSQVIENTILKIGDLKENKLNDVIMGIKHNYVFHTIFTEGFTPFIEVLKQHKIDYPKKLASPCEFCEFLFKDNWFLEILKKINYYENI